MRPYVIGGQPASEDYPFYVELLSNGRFGCGGALIAPTWVVTAAHCVGGATSVRVGGTTLGAGEAITVARQISGPSGYDIALLRLSSASSRTPSRSPTPRWAPALPCGSWATARPARPAAAAAPPTS